LAGSTEDVKELPTDHLVSCNTKHTRQSTARTLWLVLRSKYIQNLKLCRKTSLTRSLPGQIFHGCHPRVGLLPRCQLVICCSSSLLTLTL